MTDKEKKVKILFVSYWFPPYCVPGAALRLVKFLKYLSRIKPEWKLEVLKAGFGTEETVHRADSDFLLEDLPKSVRIIKINDPGTKKARESVIQRGTEVLMKRNPLVRFLKKLTGGKKRKSIGIVPIPDTQVSWNDTVKATFLGRGNRDKYTMLYITLPPFSTGALGVELKNILGRIPLIVDMRDDWSYQWKSYSDKRYDIEHAMEQQTVSNSDALILSTTASLEAYSNRYPKMDKFTVIPNGVDMEDFNEMELPSVAPSKFKVACAANLDEHRNPENFFHAFKRLLEDSDVDATECEAHFPETMLDKYWKKVGELDLGEKIFRTRVLTLDEYKRHLDSSAVLLSINYYDATTLIPVNIYEYWAVGKPILLLEHPGTASGLIRKNGLGRVADPDDPEWIYRELKRLYESYKKGELPVPDKNKLKEYNRKVQAEKLAEIIEEQLSLQAMFM